MKNNLFVVVFLAVMAAGFFTGCNMGNHNVDFSGAGKILYKGNPTKNVNKTGVGTIKSL